MQQQNRNKLNFSFIFINICYLFLFFCVLSIEAISEIVGAPDLHIDEGSQLRLECKLKHATENPTYVFWWVNLYSYSFTELSFKGEKTLKGEISCSRFKIQYKVKRCVSWSDKIIDFFVGVTEMVDKKDGRVLKYLTRGLGNKFYGIRVLQEVMMWFGWCKIHFGCLVLQWFMIVSRSRTSKE